MTEQNNESPGRAWRKSSWSDPGECVEVAREAMAVLVRDSKDVYGGVIALSVPEWRVLLRFARGA